MQWSPPGAGANKSGSEFLLLNHPTSSRAQRAVEGQQPLPEGQAERVRYRSQPCQNPEPKGHFYSLKSKSTTLGPDLPHAEDNIHFAIHVIGNIRPWRHFPGMSLRFPCNKQPESVSCGNCKTNV